MGTLQPQINGPLYSNKMTGTLAVDVTFGTARMTGTLAVDVTFGTARMGLGGLHRITVSCSAVLTCPSGLNG